MVKQRRQHGWLISSSLVSVSLMKIHKTRNWISSHLSLSSIQFYLSTDKFRKMSNTSPLVVCMQADNYPCSCPWCCRTKQQSSLGEWHIFSNFMTKCQKTSLQQLRRQVTDFPTLRSWEISNTKSKKELSMIPTANGFWSRYDLPIPQITEPIAKTIP